VVTAVVLAVVVMPVTEVVFCVGVLDWHEDTTSDSATRQIKSDQMIFFTFLFSLPKLNIYEYNICYLTNFLSLLTCEYSHLVLYPYF